MIVQLDHTRLRNLFAEMLFWRMGYERSNPDVGFGPFAESILDDMLRKHGMDVGQGEKDAIILAYKRMGGRDD